MDPLAACAVDLLAGRPPELSRGAARAVEHRLAGLFLDGAGGSLDGELRARVRRAAAREAADLASAARETQVVLDALAPLCPVVLKGLALARAWPNPAARPAGDLDLLVEARELEVAAARLEALGYRRGPADPGGRARPSPTGVELLPPAGRRMSVDLHARAFRSVGAGVDAAAIVERAQAGELCGRPVRFLDESDQLVYVLVHAAKHGAREPKWLLDLYALARLTDHATWREATLRARGWGVARPFWAAAALLSTLPSARVPVEVLRALRPSPWLRPLIGRLVRPGAAPATWERYALEWVLEDSALARARRLVGVAERLVRRD